MRLSDVLSKPPASQFVQVDGFLIGKKCDIAQQINLDIGQIALNFFCRDCSDFRTFYSKGKTTCICTGEAIISIDCILTCQSYGSVKAWFLVECEGDLAGRSPKVRILKRTVRLPEGVEWSSASYGVCSSLLDKAIIAYEAKLGAGALVYLRKAFEVITVQVANALGLSYDQYESGNPKNFSRLLKQVDEQYSIIPSEFTENRYKLYQELSGVVHGNFNEEEGLAKFEPLHRLVVGILDNVKNKQELQEARAALGWSNDGGELV